MPNIIQPCAANHYFSQHISVIANSFRQLFGYALLAENLDPHDLAESLFKAPFVLLSHNTDADPLFNYANQKGLDLFELNWQELINLPSRLSAEPVNQAERDRLLAQVTAQGFINDYHGVRISKTGKRFQIRNAKVWNLSDVEGNYQGQAACFSDWTCL